MFQTYLKPTLKVFLLSDFRLPVLAQTGQQTTFNQSSTLTYDDNSIAALPCLDQGSLIFNFTLNGVTPNGDGTLTASATGDVNAPTEFYSIEIEGQGNLSPDLGNTGDATTCGTLVAMQVYTVPLAQLQNAAGDGVIQVTATPSSGIDCTCDVVGVDLPNQATIALQFPGTT